MNRGSHYTGWYCESNISYGDYLQGNEFEKSIRYGINEQTKQLIASNEQLARENYKVLENISDGINSGFTMLSRDLSGIQDSIDSGFRQVTAVFEWGFSEVLLSLGHLNDSLDALIKIAKTPAQTWAYEQFEIARDEFRRGLYQESLDSVFRAINGYGSNPGYKTEFRFHFLQGTIRLGSFKNSDSQIIDPADAEMSFLKAAKYSRNDFPHEAAQSLLCATRAAYVQKKLEDSLRHSLNAISLNQELVEAYFQSAKTYCALGRPQEATDYIVNAIIYEHKYAVKVASDADICKYPKMLEKALVAARDKLKIVYEQERNTFNTSLNRIKDTTLYGYDVNSLCSEQLKVAYNYAKKFDDEAIKNNIWGYEHAAKLAQGGNPVIKSVVDSFKKEVSWLIDEDQQKINADINNVDLEIIDIKKNIADIEFEVTKGKSQFDSSIIDLILGSVVLVPLLFMIFRPDTALGIIVGIVILGLLSGGVVTIPIALPSYLIRKSMRNQEISNMQEQQNKLKNDIENELEAKKRHMLQKIKELEDMKSQIASFILQNQETKNKAKTHSKSRNLNDELDEVRNLLAQGDKIAAIKLVMKKKGWDLSKAKTFVETIE